MHYSRPWIPFLNGFYRFAFYAFLVTILTRLHHLQENLESLAESRAKALAGEAARNVQLEREMLEVGEGGNSAASARICMMDFCQHLTGTALYSQVLAERLPLGAALRDDARRLVELIEGGITLTKASPRGFIPSKMQSDGLMPRAGEFHRQPVRTFSVSDASSNVRCRC